MKITNFGTQGLPVALGGWSTGVMSISSNAITGDGGPNNANFVQLITSNTSNQLQNPIVNFQAGSGIALSTASNTITITGTAGGAGSTISAGSNSTRVREISTAGASSTLWSPFDHAHDGIGTITSSSSNTMQRGTFNLRAGTGIALGLTDTDGDGEFDTATISSTGGAGGAGSGTITTKDEGSTLSTIVTTLDFVGAGVVASGSGATTTVTIAGGGGVASPDWWHSDNAPGSPNADNREFTEGTTVGTLTRAAHGTPKGTWTETRNGLEFLQTATTAGDLDGYCIPRSFSVGDYVTMAFRVNPIVPGAGTAMGPFIGFSNGTTFGTSNVIAVHGIISSPFALVFNLWTGMNSRGADGGVVQITVAGDAVVGIRLKYVAANTWGSFYRAPGSQAWTQITVTESKTLTPTHIMFGSAQVSGNTFSALTPWTSRIESIRIND